MNSIYTILLGLAVVCAVLKQGEALKCYDCQSSDACNDDYGKPKDHEKDSCQYCFKFKGDYTDSSGQQKNGVFRSCVSDSLEGPLAYSKDECRGFETTINNMKYNGDACFCKGELCNAGNEIKVTLGLLFGVLALNIM